MPNNYIEQRDAAFNEKFGERLAWEQMEIEPFASFHRDSLNGLKDLILGEIERRKREPLLEGEIYDPMLADPACVAGYNTALKDLASFIKSIQ